MKTYKLERHGRLFMLKALVEGPEGAAYPRLLVDTGSAYTIISQEMLENIWMWSGAGKEKAKNYYGERV